MAFYPGVWSLMSSYISFWSNIPEDEQYLITTHFPVQLFVSEVFTYINCSSCQRMYISEAYWVNLLSIAYASGVLKAKILTLHTYHSCLFLVFLYPRFLKKSLEVYLPLLTYVIWLNSKPIYWCLQSLWYTLHGESRMGKTISVLQEQ